MPSVDKTTNMQVLIPFSSNWFHGKLILKGFYLPKSMKEKPEDITSESTTDKTRILNSHCKMKKSHYFKVSLAEDCNAWFLYVWDLGLSWCYCAPKLNSFLLYIVCISLEKKNHTGYHLPIFSFNKTNFGHRCENMLPSLPWCWW